MSNKPHNFRVVHRNCVTSAPRVIMCYNTARLSAALPTKPAIVQAHGFTFLVLKRHTKTSKFVRIEPYEGKWPRLTFWTKRALEVFA